jgi:hypothetical protein
MRDKDGFLIIDNNLRYTMITDDIVWCYTFLELGRQTPHETHLLLGVGVTLFCSILHQMVEQLRVVMHESFTLL